MLDLLMCSLLLFLFFFLYFYSIKIHFLSALLVMESMVLMLLIMSVGLSFTILEGLSIYLFVLTLSVTEAAYGLTLLMSLVKFKGSDLILGSVTNF
uniref:NADH dehydrogenase subunit 4L n=1 Tax=Zaptyx nakanoshimana TaxID=1885891 RepID=A0A224A112_9EUPU|nr:NADH dehydrogenase subunit 4L [Zaptyx nakanoshimana]